MPKDIIFIARNTARGVATLTDVEEDAAFTPELARNVGLETQSRLGTFSVVVTDWKTTYRCRRRSVVEIELPNFSIKASK